MRGEQNKIVRWRKRGLLRCIDEAPEKVRSRSRLRSARARAGVSSADCDRSGGRADASDRSLARRLADRVCCSSRCAHRGQGYRRFDSGGRVARVRFTTASRPADVARSYTLQIPAGTQCRGRVPPNMMESAVVFCEGPPPGDESQVLIDVTAMREEDVTGVEGTWIHGPPVR